VPAVLTEISLRNAGNKGRIEMNDA